LNPVRPEPAGAPVRATEAQRPSAAKFTNIAASTAGDLQQAMQQHHISHNQQNGINKACFLSHSAEDEINVLLGNKAQAREIAMQQTGTPQPSRTDADLTRHQVVATPELILRRLEKQHQPLTPVLRQAVHPQIGHAPTRVRPNSIACLHLKTRLTAPRQEGGKQRTATISAAS
jgi:hypothetical protein